MKKNKKINYGKKVNVTVRKSDEEKAKELRDVRKRRKYA